jgi:DNA modification methylase
LELAERAIRNSTRSGNIVLDTFLGSGTTLIAAQRTGRRCFGVEIDPHYCDVIARRYIAFVGENVADPGLVKRYQVKGRPAAPRKTSVATGGTG